MSEAWFYMKARFNKSDTDPDTFESEMLAVAERSCKLHEFWQSVRNEKLNRKAMCKRIREFDTDLYDRMRLEHYASKNIAWGPANMFSGLIPSWSDICEVYTDGDTLVLQLSDSLGSSQTLDPYADLLYSLGATKVAWLEESDINPFDCL